MRTISDLVGTWRMTSWVREDCATGRLSDALGPDPVGYVSYHGDGRMMALVVAKDRHGPADELPTEAEKAGLFDTMLAYAGTYTLDDEKVVHHIDVSWNQGWTGRDVVRYYNLEGDGLTLWATPTVDPFTGEEAIYLGEFRRVRGPA